MPPAQQQLNEARDKIVAGEGILASRRSCFRTIRVRPTRAAKWTGRYRSDFVPEFAEVADAAEIGAVSEPFRSRYGWHILEVMERRVYDNTEEVKENNCANRIRAGKIEEETLLWMQRMRDEAFVDKRI